MRFTCDHCGRVYVADDRIKGRAFRMRCKRCGQTISVGQAPSPAPAPEGDGRGSGAARELPLGTPERREPAVEGELELDAEVPRPRFNPFEDLPGGAAEKAASEAASPLSSEADKAFLELSREMGEPVGESTREILPELDAPSRVAASPQPAAAQIAQAAPPPEAPEAGAPKPSAEPRGEPPAGTGPDPAAPVETATKRSIALPVTIALAALAVVGTGVWYLAGFGSPAPPAARRAEVPAMPAQRPAPSKPESAVEGAPATATTDQAKPALAEQRPAEAASAATSAQASAAEVSPAPTPAPSPGEPTRAEAATGPMESPPSVQPSTGTVAPASPPLAEEIQQSAEVPPAAPKKVGDTRKERGDRQKPAPPKVAVAAPSPAAARPPVPAVARQDPLPAARPGAPITAKAQAPAAGRTVAAPPALAGQARADLPPLDEQQIQATLAKYASSFDACVTEARRDEPALVASPRAVLITMTVYPNGAVLYPTLDDAQLGPTALGACVKKQAGNMVFPESGGEPLRVRMPLVLGR